MNGKAVGSVAFVLNILGMIDSAKQRSHWGLSDKTPPAILALVFLKTASPQ